MDQKYIVIARRVLPMQVNGWGEGKIRLILSGKNFPAKITARIPHIRSANSQKITVKKTKPTRGSVKITNSQFEMLSFAKVLALVTNNSSQHESLKCDDGHAGRRT